MRCKNCHTYDIQTHTNDNHTLYYCEDCNLIFGNKVDDFTICCDYKNIGIVEYQKINGVYSKSNMCLNCLHKFGGDVKKTNQHILSVTYDERQKIIDTIKQQYWDLYKPLLDYKQEVFLKRFRESNRNEYIEYLRSDKWKEKRLQRLKLDNFTCQICGVQNGKLDVHHTTYDTFGNESIYDIITLCRNCHNKLHEND